jgi:hypothetical protein
MDTESMGFTLKSHHQSSDDGDISSSPSPSTTTTTGQINDGGFNAGSSR